MKYSAIKYNDIANGTGIRTSLFVSGCRNHCKGCFQPETWDFNYGEEFTKEIEDKIIESMDQYHDGITILGGDPFEPENQRALLPFIKRFSELCPDKSIWMYTGYLFDKDLVNGGKVYTEYTEEILSYIDILVDGPFIESEKDISLSFRGSKNQRIIHVSQIKE